MPNDRERAERIAKSICVQTTEHHFRHTSAILEVELAAVRRETVEECATVALEQRCERGTPWDLACTTIAAAIRAGLPAATKET